MSVKSKRVQYFQTTVEDRIGEAYRLLEVLAAEGVNLIAFDSVPSDAGRHQLVLYAEDAGQLRETCERKGIHLHGSGTALMVQGDDRLGALAEIHRSLLEADVSVYSSNGVADGRGGFGYLIRVRPEQSDAAARALSV